MTIRLAQIEDAPGISSLLKSYAESENITGDLSPRRIREKLAFKDDFFLVTGQENIVGVIRLSLIDLDLAEIRYLVVAPEKRKSGIGSALLKEALSFLENREMRKVITRCKSTNEVALTIFEKNGFEKEGHFRSHYRHGIDIIQLCLFIK